MNNHIRNSVIFAANVKYRINEYIFRKTEISTHGAGMGNHPDADTSINTPCVDFLFNNVKYRIV